MTDDQTPPDWVLIEAAKRVKWSHNIHHLRVIYGDDLMFRALCDMILKHEQPPVDRKLLCAREAMARSVRLRDRDIYRSGLAIQDCLRAIELWEEGFGQ